MKERPILFSGAMVRALLADTKTQTRRIVKPQPQMVTNNRTLPWEGDPAALMRLMEIQGKHCPYGQPGDRLWVRETWAHGVQAMAAASDEDGPFVYAADGSTQGRLGERWRPSIHMPRWASRITLEITGVRVERLQDISEADAIAEGVTNSLHLTGGRFARENFAHLWWTINGDGNWEANPWVWVMQFKRLETTT